MITKIQYIWTIPASKLHKLLNIPLKKKKLNYLIHQKNVESQSKWLWLQHSCGHPLQSDTDQTTVPATIHYWIAVVLPESRFAGWRLARSEVVLPSDEDPKSLVFQLYTAFKRIKHLVLKNNSSWGPTRRSRVSPQQLLTTVIKNIVVD